MQRLSSIGRIFYGVGIAGIGWLHFFYPGFRPVVLPVPPESTQHINFLVYTTAAILIVAGIAIAVGKYVRPVALFLGTFLLLFVILGHLPNRLANFPNILGAWTDALKLLTLSGGALLISTCYPGKSSNSIVAVVEKIAPYGKYFFALMLVIFGIDHFIYTDFVKTLVPVWIPGHLFWTYVGGIALAGSGLAIFIGFKPATIGLLLATMLFLWLILLHIPRAVIAPPSDNGNEWTSVLECLAFGGIALLYAMGSKKN